MQLVDCPSEISDRVVTAAINVHKELGPGLLESIYEKALLLELAECGLKAQAQIEIKVGYRGKDLGVGFRADIVVEDRLLLELKAVEKLVNIHTAQLITYLKFLNIKRGYLFNFNEKLLKNGIKRVSI